MKLLVCGPQHSCTRLFVGLLDLHPQVEYIQHLSVPTNQDQVFIGLTSFLDEADAVCVVSRDKTAINYSNYRLNHRPVHEDIAKQACEFIAKEIQNITKPVVFASFEALVNYGRVYMLSIIKELKLDTNIYPEYKNIKNYRPKSRDKNIPYWFTVNLNVEDSNAKYFRSE